MRLEPTWPFSRMVRSTIKTWIHVLKTWFLHALHVYYGLHQKISNAVFSLRLFTAHFFHIFSLYLVVKGLISRQTTTAPAAPKITLRVMKQMKTGWMFMRRSWTRELKHRVGLKYRVRSKQDRFFPTITLICYLSETPARRAGNVHPVQMIENVLMR